MLALQIALGALAGDGGDCCARCSGSVDFGVRLKEPLVLGVEAAGDDAHAVAYRYSVPASRARRAASSTDACRASHPPSGPTKTGMRSASRAGAILSGRSRGRSSVKSHRGNHAASRATGAAC